MNEPTSHKKRAQRFDRFLDLSESILFGDDEADIDELGDEPEPDGTEPLVGGGEDDDEDD